MLSVLPLLSLSIPAATPSSAAGWKLVTSGIAKTSLGLSALNSSTIYLAGGGGTIAEGAFVAVSTDAGASWEAIPETGARSMSLSNVVKVMPGTGLRVAAGVTFFGGPVAFSASGADTTAVFKAVPAKDVFSTQSLEAAHGKVFITGEWNHWGNGSVCTTPVSPQCSGVFVADASTFPDAKFSRVLWGGTDEPGVDARYGAFPTPTTWYVSGGMWPSSAAAGYAANLARGMPPSAASRSRPTGGERRVNRREGPLDGYRALITKTTDGGKTWATVFNDTGFNSSFAFYFNQIACADEMTCWAAAECPGTECPDYGAFIYHTADGGATWTKQAFFYEVSLLKVKVVSKTRVLAIGGEVGMSFGAVLVSTEDGGATWQQESLKGHGYGFGLEILPDGSRGYAITCSIGGMGGCGFWRYNA